MLDKWYRAESAYRPRIRRVFKAMVRSLVAGVVKGPQRTGSYRRWHCGWLGIGFVVGWMGSYDRSVKRVEARRAAVDAAMATSAA